MSSPRAVSILRPVRHGLLLTLLLAGALNAAAQTNASAVAAPECGGCAELRQYWQQLYEQGRLRGTVEETTLPQGFPVRLKTTNWFLLIPEINRKFPNMMLTVDGAVVTPPVVACDLAQTEVTATVDLTFRVLFSSGNQIVFTVRTPYAWSSRARLDPQFPFRPQGSSTAWTLN